MRQIDADTLSLAVQKNFGHTGGAAVLQQLIDAQPTIKTTEQPRNEEKAAEDSVLKAALERYGENMQMVVLLEEMSELEKEICKRWRGENNHFRIAEEAADVRIMLRQLEIILKNGDEVRMFERAKIERLKNRMEGEEHGQ